MNVKRIAWESRAVEHSTVPAGQRLAGAGGTASATAMPMSHAGSGTGRSTGALDRERIAKTVERVLAERGLARGASTPSGSEPKASPELPAASGIAAEIAGRLFQSNSASAKEATPAVPEAHSALPKPAAAPAVTIVPFVSEADVQLAVKRGAKIFIGPKTIVTPSARDLGNAHEVFIDTRGLAKP
jgi:hypothetical protein